VERKGRGKGTERKGKSEGGKKGRGKGSEMEKEGTGGEGDIGKRGRRKGNGKERGKREGGREEFCAVVFFSIGKTLITSLYVGLPPAYELSRSSYSHSPLSNTAKYSRHCKGVLRYDTRCYFSVRSKADTSQFSPPHGTTYKKVEKQKN